MDENNKNIKEILKKYGRKMCFVAAVLLLSMTLV
jgi:hypothetical protein